ncbi:hypothetical protein BH11ARM1_BH11ARM1_07520 [soil metagenome]
MKNSSFSATADSIKSAFELSEKAISTRIDFINLFATQFAVVPEERIETFGLILYHACLLATDPAKKYEVTSCIIDIETRLALGVMFSQRSPFLHGLDKETGRELCKLHSVLSTSQRTSLLAWHLRAVPALISLDGTEYESFGWVPVGEITVWLTPEADD